MSHRDALTVTGLATLSLVIAVAGCASKKGSSAPPDASGDSAAPPSAELVDACPKLLPTAGDACTQEGLNCQYGGEGPLLTCSRIAGCQSGAWMVGAADERCASGSFVNSAACASSFAEAETSACPPIGTQCIYGEGSCGYRNCRDSADGGLGDRAYAWVCTPFASLTLDACFPTPRLGATCTQDGANCGGASCGGGTRCKDGYWQSITSACGDVELPLCTALQPICLRAPTR